MSLKALRIKKEYEKSTFAAVAEKLQTKIQSKAFHLVIALFWLNKLNDNFNSLDLTQENILN